VTTDDTRAAALERLKSMMKKDAKREAKTRKYKVTFSSALHLQVDRSTAKPDLVQLARCHGITDNAELAQYLDGDDLETLDVAGGDVAVRFDAVRGRLWLDVSFRTVRKPGKAALSRLQKFTSEQLSDGWGEGGLAPPADVAGVLRWQEQPEHVEVVEMTGDELRDAEALAKKQLDARLSGIDSQVQGAISRVRGS